MSHGDDASRTDGISGGYCFSAAPPAYVSRYVAGRGRVPKGKKYTKSGIGGLGKGVNNSFVGSGGVGLMDGVFGQTRSAELAVGNVDDGKLKARNVDIDFDAVGGSIAIENASTSSTTYKGIKEIDSENGLRENIPDSINITISQSPLNVSGLGASPSPSIASEAAKSGAVVETLSDQPVSRSLDEQRNSGFQFSSTADGNASVKPSIFSAVDQKVEFTAKRHVARSTVSKKKKDKMKILPVQTRLAHFGKDYLMKDANPSTMCFSPNLSPFPESHSGNRLSRESSLTSHESFEFGTHSEQSDSRLSDSNDVNDEDLATLTQHLKLNEQSSKASVMLSDSPLSCNPSYATTNIPEVNSSLGSETSWAFNATSERLDAVDGNSRSSVETSATNSGGLKTSSMPNIFFSSTGETSSHSKFTFGVSLPAQEFTAARVSNSKNHRKPVADSFSENINLPYVSSLTPLKAGISLPSSPQTKGICKNDGSSFSAASLFAQELCEKWRIRGNQAYAGGDFLMAEEYYTNGVNSIPKAEKSKTCQKVLLLCYSNRAASRMALGKMREALEDCMCALAIDPSFFKAQLRAANCYLAVGEVEDASNCFKKLLQSGADVIGRKTLAEAEDGLLNAQKVSQCLIQYTTLPLHGANSDAEKCIRAIDESLSISPYCEKLLETKAEALYKLRKFEDVIQLCEHSLGTAEMNHSTSTVDEQSTYEDKFVISKHNYFRHWRYHLIVKSCFQLGKLEQAVDLLEKEASRKGNKMLESSVPLAGTVRELVQHKVAGNDAFQLGKYEVAAEHYSAALAKNSGSRPFAAICYCNRAAAYKALNQIADAISDCSLAIALDRNYTKAISRRASLFEVIRDYDQAAKDLRRLLSMLKSKIEEKKHVSCTSDKSTNLSLTNDLREAEVRLSEMEDAARKDMPINYYLILGVESLASPTEIRKAYRKSALKHHPDKAGQILGNFDAEDDALRKEMVDEVHRDTDRLFKMIGEAYTVLSDPTKRSQYDLKVESSSAQSRVNRSSPQSEFQSNIFDRSSSGRKWNEMWTSYHRQSQAQPPEANRSKW